MSWAWHQPKPRPSGSASNFAQYRQSRAGTPRRWSTSSRVMRSSSFFAGSLIVVPLVSDRFVQVVEDVSWDVAVGIADQAFPEAGRELLDQGQPADPLHPLVPPLRRRGDESQRSSVLGGQVGTVEAPGEQAPPGTVEGEATRVAVARGGGHDEPRLRQRVGEIDDPGGGNTLPDQPQPGPSPDAVQVPDAPFGRHGANGVERPRHRLGHGA